MIKTVLFDLGNVIIPLDFTRCHAAMVEAGCPMQAAEVQERIAGSGLVGRFEEGKIGAKDFVRETARILDIQMSYEQFCELWSMIFLPEALVPESMLRGLRERYRMLLLSNTNEIHFTLAKDRYPHLRHFDGFVLSYEVGVMKPKPAIYREATRRAVCEAGECLFIDDREENVEAARREGMDAVLFTSLAQLEDDMRTRRMEW